MVYPKFGELMSYQESYQLPKNEGYVESMHWLLDVHFSEDFCGVEDETVQQVLNAVRKIAINCVKTHKQKSGSKLTLSRIMFGCLLDCQKLIPVLLSGEN